MGRGLAPVSLGLRLARHTKETVRSLNRRIDLLFDVSATVSHSETGKQKTVESQASDMNCCGVPWTGKRAVWTRDKSVNLWIM